MSTLDRRTPAFRQDVVLPVLVAGVQSLPGFATTILVAPTALRLLGAPGVGRIASIAAVATYGGLVVEFASGTYGPALASARGAKTALFDVLSAKLILLAAVCSVAILAHVLGVLPISALDLIVSVPILVGAVANFNWLGVATGMFRELLLAGALGLGVNVALGVASAMGHFTQREALAFALSSSRSFANLCGFLFLSWRLRDGASTQLTPGGGASVVRSHAAIALSQLVSMLHAGSSVLMVRALAGVAEAGLLSIFDRFAGLISVVVMLPSSAMLPRLAVRLRAEPLAFIQSVRALCVLHIVLTLVGTIVLWATLQWFVAGRVWPEGVPLALPVMTQFVSLSLSVAGPLLTLACVNRGDSRFVARITGVAVACSLMIGAIAVPRIGFAGWSLGGAAGQAVVVFATVTYFRRHYGRNIGIDKWTD